MHNVVINILFRKESFTEGIFTNKWNQNVKESLDMYEPVYHMRYNTAVFRSGGGFFRINHQSNTHVLKILYEH